MRLKGKATAVYGLKGTGKSNWLQYVMSRPAYRDGHLVYDVCREHDKLKRYVPENRRDDEGRGELDTVVGRMVVDQHRWMRPEVVAIEEMSRYCSPNQRPPASVYEVVDLARHLGVGLVTIARRPAQVHSDLTELADNIIVFRLTGKNDYNALNRTVDGLGDVVRELGRYQFARVTPDRRVMVYDPVPEMNTTGRL